MQKHNLQQRRTKRKTTVQPRFFVFVGLLFGLLFLVFYPGVMKGLRVDYTVRRGVLGNPVTVDALVVRDETVVNAKTFGAYTPNVEEGAKVAEGDLVATIYDSGYSSDTVRAELAAIRSQILDYQESTLLKDINDQSLVQLNGAIDRAVGAWKEVARGRTPSETNILTSQTALTKAMEDRQDFLRKTVATSDQTLSDLYAKEKNLLDRIDSLRTDMSAPRSGYVSFFFDGREAILTTEKLELIAVNDVRSLLEGGKMTQTLEARTDRPLFRLVSPDVFYLVALFPNRDPSLVAGSTIKMSIGEGGRTVTGVVQNVASDGNEQIAVYQIKDDIGSLLGARKVKVLLGEFKEGFIVPESAVFGVNQAESTGFVRAEDGEMINVRIALVTDGEALVEPLIEGTLVQGMKLSKNSMEY